MISALDQMKNNSGQINARYSLHNKYVMAK